MPRQSRKVDEANAIVRRSVQRGLVLDVLIATLYEPEPREPGTLGYVLWVEMHDETSAAFNEVFRARYDRATVRRVDAVIRKDRNRRILAAAKAETAAAFAGDGAPC